MPISTNDIISINAVFNAEILDISISSSMKTIVNGMARNYLSYEFGFKVPYRSDTFDMKS